MVNQFQRMHQQSQRTSFVIHQAHTSQLGFGQLTFGSPYKLSQVPSKSFEHLQSYLHSKIFLTQFKNTFHAQFSHQTWIFRF